MKEITIIFGGLSRERMVSVGTGQTLAKLLPEGDRWFWRPDGVVQRVGAETLSRHEDVFTNDLVADGNVMGQTLEEALDRHGSHRTFVLGLHGGEGEDGAVAQWMETRRLPFTGSGSKASDIAFDKALSKKLVAEAGVGVAASRVVNLNDDNAGRELESLLEEWGRMVCKPVEEGSSYGLAIVGSGEELQTFLADEREGDLNEYLVEEFVSGTEITCGVVDMEGTVTGLPTVEIRPEKGRVFDYKGKYLGDGILEICPAEISADDEAEARRLAVISHNTLGCYGYSRTDFIVDDSGPVYLETNTLPGLTRSSLLPQELAEAGIGFRAFLDRQILLAERRYE